MNTGAKPRMSKEDIQQIIDSRLAVILEKELQETGASPQESGSAASSASKTRKQNKK